MDRTGLVEDPVVATQIARVVIGDRSLVPAPRGELAGGDQVVEQLAVVDDLEGASEGRVLVGQGVEAVRAGGDDLLDPRPLERLDVRPGLLLIEVLVAQPARRVTGAPLLGPEDAERDPGPVEHAGGGLRALAGPLVEGPGAADPVEVLDVVGDGPG